MDVPAERRKIITKTEPGFNRSDRISSIIRTRAQKSFSKNRYSRHLQKTEPSQPMHRNPSKKGLKTKYEDAQRAKLNEEQYTKYERNLQKQKKYEASLRFLATQKEQLFLKQSSHTESKWNNNSQTNRLYIQNFHEFQQNKVLRQPSDWEQILLKVDKRKQEQIRISKSKQRQPYQRLINKFRALNKQNYNFDNIRGINYCRQIKHEIRRCSSHSHMRSNSEKKPQPTDKKGSPSEIHLSPKTESVLKSTLMFPTKNIIEMCKDFKYSNKGLKKSMDGFEIFCQRFNNILQKKKAALFVEQI